MTQNTRNTKTTAGQPVIGLIGVGAFGKNYLRILQELHKAHEISFWGGAVSSPGSLQLLQAQHPDTRFTTNYQDMLDEVDAVCIATPASTHYDIARTCLQKAHALVEKPICTLAEEARNLYQLHSERVVMPGHVFRFHPVSEKLKATVAQNLPTLPSSITGSFVNESTHKTSREPLLEFIHWIDLVMYVFPSGTILTSSVQATKIEDVVQLKFIYQHPSGNQTPCKLVLGWGLKKKRNYTITYFDTEIRADYLTESLTVNTHSKKHIMRIDAQDALANEIRFFIDLITRRKTPDMNIPSQSVIAAITVAEIAKQQYEQQS